jgi:hypothetical protein
MGGGSAFDDEFTRLALREPEREELGAVDGSMGENLGCRIKQSFLSEPEIRLEPPRSSSKR